MKIGSVVGAVLAGATAAGKIGVQKVYAADDGGGFQAATTVISSDLGSSGKKVSGIQRHLALQEGR